MMDLMSLIFCSSNLPALAETEGLLKDSVGLACRKMKSAHAKKPSRALRIIIGIFSYQCQQMSAPMMLAIDLPTAKQAPRSKSKAAKQENRPKQSKAKTGIGAHHRSNVDGLSLLFNKGHRYKRVILISSAKKEA